MNERCPVARRGRRGSRSRRRAVRSAARARGRSRYAPLGIVAKPESTTARWRPGSSARRPGRRCRARPRVPSRPSPGRAAAGLFEDGSDVVPPRASDIRATPSATSKRCRRSPGDLGRMSFGEGEVRRWHRRRAVDQLVGGEGLRQLRIGERHPPGKRPEGVHRRVLTVEREAKLWSATNGRHAASRGGLRMPDRVGHQPGVLQPRGRRVCANSATGPGSVRRSSSRSRSAKSS